MSYPLSDIPIFGDICEQVKEEIKFYHIFGDKSVLFVTNDDRVFGFGKNNYGQLGLGHKRDVTSPMEIPQLKDKGIVRFYTGLTFVLALSSLNKLYSWGLNHNGQLAKGFPSNKIYKPQNN